MLVIQFVSRTFPRCPVAIRAEKAGCRPACKSITGFTMVELLVVIAIIGLVVALLMPAIQSARAAAICTHCSNNLRQIGIACHADHEAKRKLPRYRRCPDLAGVADPVTGRTPGCANSKIAAPRGPWKQPDGSFVLDSDTTHYPVRRHQGVFMALPCDGHVAPLEQTELLDTMFKWSGS